VSSHATPSVLFGGSSPLSIIGIFTVAFGITTTYSAVLLMRTRPQPVSATARTACIFGTADPAPSMNRSTR